ncbi:hypothetical protein [Ornithinibacillus bavariensis]|uniref:Uncharacterized protein n=1 Tax=Ornithinibacillus bavariensis TaxID=545502 RepID=A0A919XCN3_9BACI|nr:hypothetical protein [Ornithinibacillus bavariensis]GIO28575.1 hypothetical protein J43TS3_31860 [Ornithinibacillus bavariensis]HAM80256.1 hypothetical protein [Ornithinibacillus sp.]
MSDSPSCIVKKRNYFETTWLLIMQTNESIDGLLTSVNQSFELGGVVNICTRYPIVGELFQPFTKE